MTYYSSAFDSHVHLFWLCEKPNQKGRKVRITAPSPEEARKILDKRFPDANILFKKTLS